MVGDILRFLARPKEASEYLAATLEDIPDDSIYLVGHSLGGVICLDLLTRQVNSNVRGLVTVGSQSPFLYEIGALPTVPPHSNLPDSVPRWLNIFDRRDLLAFVGEGVFPQRVEDFEVDNKRPFIQSHLGYWTNALVWSAIDDFVSRDGS